MRAAARTPWAEPLGHEAEAAGPGAGPLGRPRRPRRRISRSGLFGRPPAGPALLAAAGLTAGAVAVPLVYVLVRAAGGGPEVWERLLRTRLLSLLGNTLVLTLAVTAATVILGVGLAWLTERTDLPGRRFFRWLLALPLAIPAYVGAVIHLALLRSPGGRLTGLLRGVFGEGVPLPSPVGLAGPVFVLALFTYPYVYLLTAAALRSLPAVYEEAAHATGRGPLRTFWQVTLPALRPGILAGAVLVALDTLAEYGTVALLRYETLSSAVFVQLTGRYDRAAASVLSGVLIVLALLILWGEQRLKGRGRFVHFHSSWRPAPVVRLGRWRIPALLAVLLVCGLSLLVPLGVLTAWTVQGLLGPASAQGLSGLAGLGGYLWSSLWSAGLAAVAAVLLSLTVATLVVRHPGPLARALSRVCQVGYAIPGVVVALSLILLISRSLTFLYATPIIVVLAYVIRHMPQAVRASETSLARVSPEVEEAARSLHRRPLAAFFQVTFRLALPGLLAGGALVFLTSLKELPATLLLRPAGFDTLAVRVWTWAGDGYYPQAAPAALLLVVAAMVPLFFVLRGQRASR